MASGRSQQQVKVLGHALPVIGQFFGRGAGGERAQQGADQLGVLRGLQLALGLQRIAQAHEGFDTGDDAGLFGEGWEWQADDEDADPVTFYCPIPA